MKEFLTKKYGGLPGWSWLLIGVAGIGAGYLLIRWQRSKQTPTTGAGLNASTTPDLTTGNTSGAESNPATGEVGSNGIIDNPFPETNVGGNQVPIIPPGYQAVYDQNGNIIGFEPIPTSPTSGTPPPTSTPPVTTPNLQGLIRSSTGQGYDKTHPGGIPLRTSPGGATSSEVPFGATVSITGGAKTGPVNAKGGSTQWYPVKFGSQTGFISAADFLNIFQGATGGTGTTPLSPIVPLSASRRKAA